MSRLLSKIKAPNDVKKLAANELPELCDEIREEIISTVADNGGHLASNLGVVELTVALHRVFTLPEDCIVWDVGHQSYAHKLLTGREEAFSTLRREDGLSVERRKRLRPVYNGAQQRVHFFGARPFRCKGTCG